ncbi:MAG: hypothetical protein ACTS7I_00420 [Candidatus Hodgkinia cicadicola]
MNNHPSTEVASFPVSGKQCRPFNETNFRIVNVNFSHFGGALRSTSVRLTCSFVLHST